VSLGPPVDPVQSADRAPDAADVVVVGGGIIGVSAALFLARKGCSVAVCEKGLFAGEQCSRNWGWVRRMGRDPRELPLIVEAMRIWDGMEALVGRDVGFRRTGILYLCESEADVARRQDWLGRAGEYAFDTKIISGAALSDLLPGAARTYPAALYTASDGRAEPQKATPAIASAAAAAGAILLADCAVHAIETSAGRASAVVTERGRIAASTVVVAAGVWTSAICRTLGLRLPQLGVRSSVLRTGPVEGGPDGAAWGPQFAYRKRLDGGYTIANGSLSEHDIVADSFRYFRDFLPLMKRERRSVALRLGKHLWRSLKAPPCSRFEGVRVLDPEPWKAQLDRTYAALQAAFPAFRCAPIVQQWAGVIDATPDAIPVISSVRSHPGLIVATGFSGHGFGIGPGAGRLVAELATGATPIVDPKPFRYERFIDGTRPRPTTGV
jgi:glycine/D-amino acid oxidase-like deaminating enzyme